MSLHLNRISFFVVMRSNEIDFSSSSVMSLTLIFLGNSRRWSEDGNVLQLNSLEDVGELN